MDAKEKTISLQQSVLQQAFDIEWLAPEEFVREGDNKLKITNGAHEVLITLANGVANLILCT